MKRYYINVEIRGAYDETEQRNQDMSVQREHQKTVDHQATDVDVPEFLSNTHPTGSSLADMLKS